MAKTSFIVACVFSILIQSGCEKSELVLPPSPVPVSEISGRIVDWQFGDSMTVSATTAILGTGTSYVLASSSVRGDGTFHLSLTTPPPSTLRNFTDPLDTVSDVEARVMFLPVLDLSNPGGSTSYLIQNMESHKSQEPSEPYVMYSYIYADRPLTWRRTDIGGPPDTLTIVGDLELAEGWNREVARTQVLPTGKVLVTARIESSQARTWYIIP